MSTTHIAALAFIALLSACSKPNPDQTASTDTLQHTLTHIEETASFAAPPASTAPHAQSSRYSPLKPNGEITLSRCRMGACSWTKWLSVKSLGSSESQQVLETTLLEGSSVHGGAKDPPSPEDVAIDWNPEPRTVKVTCSHTNPSISTDVLPLNPETGVPGALESAVELYFAACHSYFGDYPTGIEKFSYDVKG